MNNNQLSLDDLLSPVDIGQTTRAEFSDLDSNVPNDTLVTDIFQVIENEKAANVRVPRKQNTTGDETKNTEEVEEPEEVEVDTTDYTLPEGTKKVILETSKVNHALSQLSSIIDLNSTRAVSRGITLNIVNEEEVEIICPNELYYFKATLPAETNLDAGEKIFIEYEFLQKIARFIPSRFLIYLKDETYYIRLTTQDLELLNTRLIEQDVKKLTFDYKVTDKLLGELDITSASKLNSMAKLLSFEADSPRRLLNGTKDSTTFKSAQLLSHSKLSFPDIKVNPKVSSYLLKAFSLLKNGDTIKIYDTDSSPINRYAIKSNDSVMITNYPTCVPDEKTKEVFEVLPQLTIFDYSILKYNLEYANSVTYALGLVTLNNIDNKLVVKLKLNNGNESNLTITTSGDLYLEQNKEIKVSTKSLLNLLNALDPSLETKIGYKDGLLYIVNSDLEACLVTY